MLCLIAGSFSSQGANQPGAWGHSTKLDENGYLDRKLSIIGTSSAFHASLRWPGVSFI